MTTEYPDGPRLAVGGVVIHKDRVLLVRRGKPPAEGQWAIPGGSVELGESMARAVERELLEETGVRVLAGDVCCVFEAVRRDTDDRVRFHYVIVDLLAEYVSGTPAPGSDALAAAWKSAVELAEMTVNANTLELLRKLAFLPYMTQMKG